MMLAAVLLAMNLFVTWRVVVNDPAWWQLALCPFGVGAGVYALVVAWRLHRRRDAWRRALR